MVSSPSYPPPEELKSLNRQPNLGPANISRKRVHYFGYKRTNIRTLHENKTYTETLLYYTDYIFVTNNRRVSHSDQSNMNR